MRPPRFYNRRGGRCYDGASAKGISCYITRTRRAKWPRRSGPANHIRVNGAPPGASYVVTLFPGGAPAPFYVQSVSPGGFWLRLEATGATVASVTGVAH